MIQRFIELGEGYSDIFELCEIFETNKHRFHHAFVFKANYNGAETNSIAIALKSIGESKFMPIYICREGIPTSSKRLELFNTIVNDAGYKPILVEVKHSKEFAEKNLYFQYLTGILRLNNLIPPLN